MKIILIGSVGSSYHTLLKLIEYEFNIVAVFGLEPKNPKTVSGYTSLKDVCKKNSISYFPFTAINDELEKISSIGPDIIFAIGISQLIRKPILDVPKLGCIGFHPTKLPSGRGRAPISWMILKEKQGAASFFLMGEEADDGPIFVQVPFDIEDMDDSATVREKIYRSIGGALDKWLPELKRGVWNPIPQDHNRATFYEKRYPNDGIVNWSNSAEEIEKLIKAVTGPYPGAYTFYKDNKLTIWKSRIENNLKIVGVIGRILRVKGTKILIQTGFGLLWLEEYELNDIKGNPIPLPKFRVGEMLGYNIELEIFKLKNRIG